MEIAQFFQSEEREADSLLDHVNDPMSPWAGGVPPMWAPRKQKSPTLSTLVPADE